MNIEYRAPNLSEYLKLRSLVGWWDTDEKATEFALNNALFSVVIKDQNAIIGIGRIIGDGGLYFYIQDIIIHPEYQNKGFGKSLMKEIMNFINTNAKSGAFVGLMAAKGLEKYYNKFGFKAREKNAPGMYQIIE